MVEVCRGEEGLVWGMGEGEKRIVGSVLSIFRYNTMVLGDKGHERSNSGIVWTF